MLKQYDLNNIFNKILNNELPCRKVYEDDFVLSFYDINPKAKIHVLVITKNHYINFFDFMNKASTEEVLRYYQGINNTVKVLQVNDFCLLSNNGSEAGQEIFHFHCHILSDG